MADDLRTRLLAVVAGCGEPICPICEKINEAVAALDERDERIKALEEGLRQLMSNAEIAKNHLPPEADIVSSALFDTIEQARNLLTNPTPAKPPRKSRILGIRSLMP